MISSREREREHTKRLECGGEHTLLLLLNTASLGFGSCFGAGLRHGFGGGFRFGVSRCL